jgi:hypothetical protein
MIGVDGVSVIQGHYHPCIVNPRAAIGLAARAGKFATPAVLITPRSAKK